MRNHFCAAVLALSLGAASATGQPPPPDNSRLGSLTQWMDIAAQHTPGRINQAVATIRDWERESLQSVRDDLAAIRLFLCERCARPSASFPTSAAAGIGRPAWSATYTRDHLRDLETLARDVGRRNINDVLKRGALLHTDIALRAPPIMVWAPTATHRPLMHTVVRVADGQQGGVDEAVDHLEMARRLLDLVTPDPQTDLRTFPERDQTVRSWYRATMAVLLDRRQMDGGHTRAALELLPDDGNVLFMAGAFHETLADPRFQRAVTTRTLSNVSFIESERDELQQAERLFRGALKINPEYAEARLRLGQVLGRLGRHGDSLTELGASLPAIQEPLLIYYANLFIGREEDALGNVARARAAYERAAALFPRAQSPRLALSELEMRQGNRTAAVQLVDMVWGWRVSPQQPEDPWQSYTYSAGRAGEALLAAIGSAFRPVSSNR